MPYRSFADFSRTLPLPSDYLVGYRPNLGEFQVDFYAISNLLSGGLWSTPNVLYVTVSGSDTNVGTAENYPFKTIKKACQYAASNPGTQYTIFVKTGAYYEKNPVYVPQRTSIIGDNLRRTSVYPQNSAYDLFWVTNADYIWGFTFRGHKRPAAAIAFPHLDSSLPDYQVAFNTPGYVVSPPTGNKFLPGHPLYIFTSPYIQGCSSITQSTAPGADDAGAGMRIDGKLVGGYIRSMVLDSYTQFNEGGDGIIILNNGYAQLVSIFTIGGTTAVMVSAGGQCDINTSNASFGLSGLVAFGKSNTPMLTGTLVRDISANTPNSNKFLVGSVTPNDLARFPGELMVFDCEADPTTTLFTIVSTLSVGGNGYEEYTYELTTEDAAQNYISAGPVFEPEGLYNGNYVRLYFRSQILASAYTMEYVGAGSTLATALPVLGGFAKPENEVRAVDGARIFVTLTNEKGDFKVGSDFTIRQATGTIEGRTFNRSIFSLITPFVLSLE